MGDGDILKGNVIFSGDYDEVEQVTRGVNRGAHAHSNMLMLRNVAMTSDRSL